MRKKLEFQADRIEAVLSLHKVPARVTGGTVTPRWVRFQALPAVGANISRIKNLSEELAAALDAPSCRVSRRGAAVAIEVPRQDSQPVRLLPLYKQLCKTDNRLIDNTTTAILGLAEDGAPLLIRLPSPDVGHVLVVGNEGAGKTALLQTMGLSLAMMNSPDNLAFIFLGDELPELARAVGQIGFSTYRIEEIGMAILRAGIGTDGKRVIVIADDVVGEPPDGENNDVAVSRLGRLMKSNANRHYILGWLGVPSVEACNLFNVRLVGRMFNVEDARVATGWIGSGAERLLGRGDFLAVAEGRASRFQAAHVSPSEIQEIAARLAQGRLAPTRISLSQTASQLTEAFQGGA